MKKKEAGLCSGRERTEMTMAALIPAGIGLLGPAIMLAGRLSWLGAALALPVGVCLSPAWRRLGKNGLVEGLEEAFGGPGGKGAMTLYFLWGLILLADSARRYSERLLTVSEGEGVRWFFLFSALAVCLLLGRGSEQGFGRAGRIFFLAAVAALGIAAALGLSGIQWQNLWPPEGADWRGLPGSGALCLSLAGYGVYALCFPARTDEKGTWAGAVWGCVGLTLLLFLTVGTFGPTLAGQMGEPFLYLLEGVRAPGVFRRGDAGLLVALALGDLLLLSMLGRGCVTLWERLVPVFPALGWVPVGGAFVLAGVLPGLGRTWAWLSARIPTGNLILGVLLPAVAVLTIRVRERRKKRATFCGKSSQREIDVAVDPDKKKSTGENEKKC